MNIQLSNAAWIALLCILAIVLLSAIVLYAAWRQKDKPRRRSPSRSGGYSFTRGWEKEDAEIKKLSEAVKTLSGDKKDST